MNSLYSGGNEKSESKEIRVQVIREIQMKILKPIYRHVISL